MPGKRSEQFNVITLWGTHVFPRQQKRLGRSGDKACSENAWNAASHRQDEEEISHKQTLTSFACQLASH